MIVYNTHRFSHLNHQKTNAMKTLLRTILSIIMVTTVISVSAQPQRGNRGERPDPETYAKEMSDYMAKELGLNDKQKKDIYDIELKAAKARPEGRLGQGRQSLSEEEVKKLREDREKRMQEHQDAVKKVLNDEQYKKWSELRREQMGRMGQMRNGETPERRQNLSNKDEKAVCPVCNMEKCICKKDKKSDKKKK